jgi:putative ABC transport system permease protein
VSIYRGCLALYPAEFREEYGRELCLAFADRWREERTPAGMAMLWLASLEGIVKEAPKEHCQMILQDLRFALRVMRKDLAVTAAALAILALGIGATTLVFSLANGLLLRPLPYAEQDRLVALEEYSPQDPNENHEISLPNFADIAARAKLFEGAGVYGGDGAILRDGEQAESVEACVLSYNVLPTLGARPIAGRLFTKEEAWPHGPKAVIIGEDLWTRRYGRDANIIGRSIALNSTARTVIGVLPSNFHFPGRAELWLPLQANPAEAVRTDYGAEALALLKPGATVEQASTEMESLLEQVHREHPEANNHWRARVTPLRVYQAETYRAKVLTLLAAVAILLLIACANVSNLLLVKASARGREMAVRTAMGASRRRLVRQLVCESLILGMAGGASGAALAAAGLKLLLRLIPINLPLWMDFRLDARVLLFTLAVSILTSLVFGLAPAFGASRVDLVTALKGGGRSVSSGRHKLLRNGLVIAEIALSMILLAGAGLTVRSFLALRGQNLGYRPEHVLSLQLAYPGLKYPDGPRARAMVQTLEREVSTIPGVKSAAFTTGIPLHDGWTRLYTVEGRPKALKDIPFVNHVVVGPGFFETLGIPLLEGRTLADSDYEQPNVMVVTRAFARQNFPNESAVGKRIRFGPPKNEEPWHTIVGVVADNNHEQLKAGGRPVVYLPYYAEITPSSMLVRTAGDPAGIVLAVRSRITSFDKSIVLTHVFTMTNLIERASWQDRFLTILFTGFAAIALTLAVVGLYAVLSYAVSLETREIGIRMALGASVRNVQGAMMRSGLTLAAAGLAIGIVAALRLTELLRSQLFGVTPMDPATYVTTAALLLTVAALAAWIPARRATRVDPLTALRWE